MKKQISMLILLTLLVSCVYGAVSVTYKRLDTNTLEITQKSEVDRSILLEDKQIIELAILFHTRKLKEAQAELDEINMKLDVLK